MINEAKRRGSEQSLGSSIPSLVFFLLLSAAAAAFGGMFAGGLWYEGLTKPALNPPAWLFGPVWTLLYILMAVAAWLVWRSRKPKRDRHVALGLYLVQLLLNALWSWIFFGLHSLTGALVEILLLNVAIIATIFAFRRVSVTAARIMVPYWLWVCFATYLTWGIRSLNG